MMKSLTVYLFLLSSVLCYAQSDFKTEIKVGATVFTGWEYNIDNAEFISKLDTNSPDANLPFGFKPIKNQFETSKNSFYLERAYINVIASLTPDIWARVTPDIFTFSDGSGKTQYALGIKNAYINYTPFKWDNGMAVGFDLGVVGNNWKGTNERYWGYRGFLKTLTDYGWMVSASRSGNVVNRVTSAYFPSADLGFNLNVVMPKGFAELQVQVLNGNGYTNLSFDNRFKDIFPSLFIHPLASVISRKMDAAKKNKKDRIDGITDVTIGGFGYFGKLDKGENYTPGAVQYKRNRFGGMAHLRLNFKKFGFFKIGGEYSVVSNEDPSSVKPDSLVKTNSAGMSAYLEVNPPVEKLNEKLMLIARYDMFDPNTNNQSSSLITFNDNTDKQTVLMLGLVFKPAKVLAIGLYYFMTTYNQNFVVKYDGTTTNSDSRLALQTILNF